MADKKTENLSSWQLKNLNLSKIKILPPESSVHLLVVLGLGNKELINKTRRADEFDSLDISTTWNGIASGHI